MRRIVLTPALALSLSLVAGMAHAQYDGRGAYERSTVITSPALGGGTTTTTTTTRPNGSDQHMPTGLVTRLDERVDQLEEMVRQLTGRVEELQYKNGQLSKQVERLQADTELRFKDLQSGGGSAAGAAAPGAAPGAAPQQLSMPAASGGSSDRVVLTPPKGGETAGSGVLGTMPEKDMKTALPKPSDPQALYDAAYAAAQAGDYATAEAGFRDFLDKNPKHSLAGNAQYWLGDIAYSKKDFNTAAATFLDGYKKFPKHPKSPDMIYKAGSSFGQMGKTKEACTAFAILFADQPQMPERVKRAATAEKKKYGCK